MPYYRRVVLTNNQIYHVFNRSIAKEEIFLDLRICNRMLDLLWYYRFKQKLSFSHYKKLTNEAKKDYVQKMGEFSPLVEIYAFVLMPTHFHLLLKQLLDDGIKTYVSNIQNSFAKYYNTLRDRDGGLFKSPFQTRVVYEDEEFLHVSRYMHLNPTTAFLVKPEDLEKYIWSSYPDYINKNQSKIVNTTPVLEIIGSPKKYREFVMDNADYQRKLHLIRRFEAT